MTTIEGFLFLKLICLNQTWWMQNGETSTKKNTHTQNGNLKYSKYLKKISFSLIRMSFKESFLISYLREQWTQFGKNVFTRIG